MNGFKLYSILLNNGLLTTDLINFTDDYIDNNENYFTLIIGNNGTGKSRILSQIARYFNNLYHNEQPLRLFRENIINYNKIPTKVIAITNSISDKFPIDQSFRTSLSKKKEIFHRNFYYNYLGTRNRINSFSNRALMNRALEIVFESYSEIEVSRNYRHIFEYLEYEPVIKLTYKFQRLSNISPNEITADSILTYVENKMGNEYIYHSDELVHLLKKRISEIINLIRAKLYEDSREYELTINFSEKNINRIRQDNSIYSENVNEYEILNILRKIGLIQSFRIHVFKKGGTQFNFSDASSGEASILSTLLSLIPLVKDNSLILIDEPEISLHPLWQSKYIDLLNKILETVKGCHIIIASHSPFLASDLKPQNSSVITLKNKKGIIYSTNIHKSTYGWSAEDILLNVFELQSTRNFTLYENVTEALILLADNNRDQSKFLKIQKKLQEFYPYILDSDPIKTVIKSILDIDFL